MHNNYHGKKRIGVDFGKNWFHCLPLIWNLFQLIVISFSSASFYCYYYTKVSNQIKNAESLFYILYCYCFFQVLIRCIIVRVYLCVRNACWFRFVNLFIRRYINKTIWNKMKWKKQRNYALTQVRIVIRRHWTVDSAKIGENH